MKLYVPLLGSPDVLDHDTILNELAQLSLIAYDQCRRDKAKVLGIRVGALDVEVAKRRPQTAQPDAQGTQVIFETPQLWFNWLRVLSIRLSSCGVWSNLILQRTSPSFP